MKIALFGDLHGNRPATAALEKDIEKKGADALYCLGDLVGKGPDSPWTMDWAFANCQVILMGNWDEGIVKSDSETGMWYRAQLGQARLEKLAQLPMEHRFAFSGRKVRLVHGRNFVPGVVYPESPAEEKVAFFRDEDGYTPDFVAYADIHRPFYEQIRKVGVLLNTGSVGNPLLRQPYPTYALLEGDMGETRTALSVTIVQLEYDREEAVRLTEAVPDLPMGDAFIKEIMTGQYSR